MNLDIEFTFGDCYRLYTMLISSKTAELIIKKYFFLFGGGGGGGGGGGKGEVGVGVLG